MLGCQWSLFVNLPYLSECELSRELTLNHDVEDRLYLCRVVNLMNPWKDVTVQYRVDSWGGEDADSVP